MQKKANPAALLPILEFLLLYLGLGLIFEYVLKIPMGFYSIPIVVIFLVALLAACCQNRALSFDDKLTLMGQGIGDKNIVTMLLIFLAAGIFAGFITGRSGEIPQGRELMATLESNLPVALPKGATIVPTTVQAVAAQPVQAVAVTPAPAAPEDPEGDQ